MPDLTRLLHSTFGFASFRVNQEAVCRAATDGRDVLLVMPTGAGKSLCYQLPAIARGGTALVVSPLIALMDDQANKLTAAGLRVARIHSGLSREDSRQACRDYLDGKLQFLFIAPERMRVPGFPEMLARRKPALVAIDEAHCISAWGHDFRPDYRMLGDHLPALRPAPVIALTATATPAVQRDIVAQLHLQQPALFIHGFRRENLAIEAVELSKPRRTEFTTQFLTDPARRPAIVYAPSRRVAEELAADLNRVLKSSKSPGKPGAPFIAPLSHAMSGPAAKTIAAAYHAGLPPDVRERVQRQFQAGELEVVVATIAFGMGIDKADVRSVVHFALPASVEAFYQEIGRAGRDGLPSRTVLLYSFVDRRIHETFLERDYPDVSDLLRVSTALTEDFLMPEEIAGKLKMDRDVVAKSLEKLASQGAAQFDIAGNVRRSGATEWQTGYQQQVEFRRNQIDRMMAFAETQQCRMTALIRHFGDTADSHRPCGHCDFCAPSSDSAQPFAAPTAAQERDLRTILRALNGQSKSTGRLHTELALTPDRKVFDGLLEGLARAGLITLASEVFTNPEGRQIPYKKAALTHEGREIGENEPLGVLLRSECAAPAAKTAKKKKAVTEALSSSYTPAQTALEEKLREWRKQEAAKTGKPAFMVFGDSALNALVHAAPTSIPELLQVAGFGPDKAERFGAELCAICRGQEESRAASPVRRSPAATPKRSEPISPAPSKPAPAVQEFKRERPAAPDPANALNPGQQALELRLREWRKTESEKMGLPQFFVLGSTALRSIVLDPPRNLAQLKTVAGIDAEKLERFGPSILQLCNG
jgi:ATP-dependent DNA helicase RecQ